MKLWHHDMMETLQPAVSMSSSAVGGVFEWLLGTLLGTIATTVVVLAVASIGFLMLTGRVQVRRALTIILGCFVLLGASSIASGLRSAVSGSRASLPEDFPIAQIPQVPAQAYPQVAPSAYDPYAGAALVPRE